MIIRLNGGLGNQLFQYSLGCALKEKYGVQIKYDESLVKKDKLRECGIEYFVDDYEKTTKLENIIWKVMSKLSKGKGFGICTEKEYFLHEEILPQYRFLNGYWQNTKYFEDIRPRLIEQITYRGELNEKQIDIIESMQKVNSVAVHIRRGDYLKLSEVYAVAGLEYYSKAMEYFNNQDANCVFYMFSDDISWCKENFGERNNIIYIDQKISNSPYIDFELMRYCRNYIIANSTFSWWASWLSKTETQTMIAPSKWFHVEKTQNRIGDALLKGYILM